MRHRSGWASSVDVAIAASVSAALGFAVRLAAFAIPPDSAVYSAAAFGIVAIAIPAAAIYWVIGRCWWLIRDDDGHVGFSTAAIVALAAGSIGNLSFTLSSPLFSVPDLGYLLISGGQTLGLAFFTIALLRWSRTPAWFTWVAYAYLGILAAGVIGRILSSSAIVSTSGFANSIFVAALAVALFSDARRAADTAVEVAQ